MPVRPMTAYVPDAVDLVDPDVAAATNAVLQPPDGKVLNPPKGAATKTAEEQETKRRSEILGLIWAEASRGQIPDNNGVPVVWPVSPMTAYVPDAVDLVDPHVAAAANAVLQPPDGNFEIHVEINN